MLELAWAAKSLPIVAVLTGGWMRRVRARLGPAAADGGEPVPDAREETRCLGLIRAVARGRSPAARELPRALLIGPGLWERLRGDAEVAILGRPLVGTCPAGPEEVHVEGRVLEGADRGRFLATAAVRRLFARLADGQARAATVAERHHHCVVNSDAVRGRPVTVIEAGGDRLLLHRERDGAACWLDLLSAYPVHPLMPEEAARLGDGGPASGGR